MFPLSAIIVDLSRLSTREIASLPIVDRGISSLNFSVDDSTVMKHPTDADAQRDHQIEGRIYERLGHHPRVVKVVFFGEGWIALERLKGSLPRHLVSLQPDRPSIGQMVRWSRQAAEGLQYLHEKAVFQTDVGAHNLHLDERDNLKFCDFAGSSIDREKPSVLPSSIAQCPGMDFQNGRPTVQWELFLIGVSDL